MSSTLNRALFEPLLRSSFQTMKVMNSINIEKEDSFVDKIKEKIEKLDGMLEKKKKIVLGQAMYQWRS